MLPKLLAISGLLLGSLASSSNDGDEIDVTRTYRVLQTVSLTDIEPGAKKVQWWISIPDDARAQDLLDFAVVDAPGEWRIVRDLDRSNRFLYVEVTNPGVAELTATVEFTVRREPVHFTLDPARVGPLTETHRKLFSEYVRRDAPHMEVTPEIQRLADAACGDETNPATQVRALLDLVVASADHYTKDPTKPSCGVGDAGACLAMGGGCCTDLHSLFVSLARARGIPSRVHMGYRLNPKRLGVDYDPGYRCWVEYFLPGLGWVPADVVEADAPGGLGPERWFSGLSEWRLWLNEGREFRLPPVGEREPVNAMVIGYALVDGREVRVLPEGDLGSQLKRSIRVGTVPLGW